MNENQNIEQGKARIVYEEGNRKCIIKKVGKTSKCIKLGIGSPDYSNSYTAEAPKVACQLLKECCLVKIAKLKNPTSSGRRT